MLLDVHGLRNSVARVVEIPEVTGYVEWTTARALKISFSKSQPDSVWFWNLLLLPGRHTRTRSGFLPLHQSVPSELICQRVTGTDEFQVELPGSFGDRSTMTGATSRTATPLVSTDRSTFLDRAYSCYRDPKLCWYDLYDKHRVIGPQ